MVAVGEGRRPPGWAGEVLRARQNGHRGHGGARARADPGGGLLPGGRRARRPRPGPRGSRGRCRRPLVDDHYFSADPSVAFRGRRRSGDVWGHQLALTSRVRACSPRAGSTSAPRCCSARPSRRPPSAARPRLRLRADRAGPGGRGARVGGAGRRRQRAGGAAGQRERRVARPGRALLGGHPGPGAGRRALRRDLVEPADPGRQGGPARAAAALAAAPGAGRPRGDGGRQEPRRGLAAALAGRAGLPATRLSSAKGFRVLEVRRGG